jgi:hypothetical protein
MLLFRSEEHARAWIAQNRMPAGEILPYEQVLELSHAWYGNRMHIDFAGRTPEQCHQVFEQVRLRSSFWRYDAVD